MGGASSFYAMLAICGFLTAAWSATKVSRLVGISSIVLEIATGVVLGPRALGLINDEYAECEHQRHTECKAPADLDARVAQGLPIGEHLGRIANMDYCDKESYLVLGGDLGHDHTDAGHHDEGHQDPKSSDHSDPQGDGNLSGGNASNASATSAGPSTEASSSTGTSTMLPTSTVTTYLGAHRDVEADSSTTSTTSTSVTSSTTVSSTTTRSTTGTTTSPAPSGGVAAQASTTAGLGSDDLDNETSAEDNETSAEDNETSLNNSEVEGDLPVAGNVSQQLVPAAGNSSQQLVPAVGNASQQLAGAADGGNVSTLAPTSGRLVANNSDNRTPAGGNETSLDNREVEGELPAVGNVSRQLVDVADGGGSIERQLSGAGGGGAKYSSYGECLERSCEAHVAHHCSLTPDVFTLIGHAGVALMIFESGMHFDFEKAREVGPWACVVAVIGTIMPLATGCLLVMAYGKPGMPQGISAGTALAPTSVGISLRLLGEAGVLQENFGQAIITAAFVDDILSLVLFNVLFSLGGEFSAVQTILFPIIGIIFMLLAMVAAVKFWPWAIESVVLAWAPDVRDVHATGLSRIRLTRDEILFLLMIVVLVVYSTITHLLGTHLWGCFIAGMSFACLEPAGHAHHLWSQQTKRITTWMVRIFFACTVAFSIPLSELLSWNAFWKGTIMGVGPCILTKVLCALFMGPARFVIGWAMVGRAEFAYLIAQMARAANMIDGETFSICIWALLYATIFAPFVFRYLLNNYVEQYGLAGKDGAGRALSKAAADQDEEAEEPAGGRSSASAHAEKGAQQRDFAGARSGDEEAPERLADLEAIKIGSGPVEKDGRLDAQPEVLGQPCEEYDSDSHMLPASSLTSVRPSSLKQAQGTGRKGARGIGATIFPGAAPGSSGLLCCLFFKKVVME